eukprot:4747933-Prymnesium_polylepis.2
MVARAAAAATLPGTVDHAQQTDVAGADVSLGRSLRQASRELRCSDRAFARAVALALRAWALPWSPVGDAPALAAAGTPWQRRWMGRRAGGCSPRAPGGRARAK